MTLENSDIGTISLEDAAMSMVQTDSQEQPEPKEDADPALEADLEATEIGDDADDTEEESDDDDAAEDDDDQGDGDEYEDVFLIDGEEVTASELQEWKKGTLRQSDYTKKTQEVAEQRQALQAELTAFNAEKMRVTQEIQQQQAQLKDALATFAVSSTQEPDWQEAARTMDPKAFQTLQADWAAQQQKSAQAQQVYQSLQQQQAQQAQAREVSALVEKRPDWGSPDVFNAATARMAEAVEGLGITRQDIEGITDHRMYLVLDALAQATASAAVVDGEKVKAKKRVVKAAKRVPAGAKPAKNQAAQKQRRSQEDRFKRSGAIEDAIDVIMQG